MLKRIGSAVRNFFFPPPGARRSAMLMGYLTLTLIFFGLFVGGAYAWDYTNSPQFCGTQCHTMPPEFNAYLVSPHARISCTECHIGREFFGNQFLRKAGDMRHVIAQAFTTYTYPITVHEMRPAREICERCHSPEKFADDSLRTIRHYGTDAANTPYDIYLVLKTGGGSKQLGQGQGIHWHIQNDVRYYESDASGQSIPVVRVYADDGTYTEYKDLESGVDTSTLAEGDLHEMDCITCHNRISHLIQSPEESVEGALERGALDVAMPEIRLKGVEVLRAPYASSELAMNGIAGLESYYRVAHPDYYAANKDAVLAAVKTLQDIYTSSVYPEQKVDWDAHPNNLGHEDFAGCFRCHDGKHLNDKQEAIPLECNLCHSVPVVAGREDFVTDIQISRGPEPESHKNSNWISGHRDYFDRTCQKCHTVTDPGGTSNTSFCSNSACHGSAWEFAGFDAPGLREMVLAQLPPPEPEVTFGELAPNYESLQPVFEAECGLCHGTTDPSAGLVLTTYAGITRGSENGPVVVAGDVEGSKLIEVQTGEHFGLLSLDALEVVKQWIADGLAEQ